MKVMAGEIKMLILHNALAKKRQEGLAQIGDHMLLFEPHQKRMREVHV